VRNASGLPPYFFEHVAAEAATRMYVGAGRFTNKNHSMEASPGKFHGMSKAFFFAG
jgi:hypothetical protein